MAGLFEFRWAVDQDGYEIEHIPASTGISLLDTVFEHDEIRPRGGPLREYRPMDDHLGLWRQFATCADADGALAFARQFGLPFSNEPNARQDVAHFLGWSGLVRQLAGLVDSKRYVEAAELWSAQSRPRLTAALIPTHREGRFEFRPVPQTLHAALMLQAGEAIARNQEWRHCRNDECPEWFRIGDGARTSRREFCSDRCRVAWARRHKAKQEA